MTVYTDEELREAQRRIQQLGDLAVPRVVQTLTALGVPALVASEGMSSADLAVATGCHEDALRRVLRAATAAGVFEEVEPDTFRGTALSEILRSGHAYSWRPTPLDRLHDQLDMALGQLLRSTKTGRPAYPELFGETVWQSQERGIEGTQVWRAQMARRSRAIARAVLDADLWDTCERIVDVGGGTGTLLAALLDRHPTLEGVLFDLPATTATAVDLGERATTAAGDMFESVPPGGDLYLLSSVLHDWDDDGAAAILDACRRAITDTARLAIIEILLDDHSKDLEIATLDLRMLVHFGGRERTLYEYQQLLRTAGFQLTDTVRTDSPWSLLIAKPVALTRR